MTKWNPRRIKYYCYWRAFISALHLFPVELKLFYLKMDGMRMRMELECLRAYNKNPNIK